jgi:GTPase SAR1 family protein
MQQAASLRICLIGTSASGRWNLIQSFCGNGVDLATEVSDCHFDPPPPCMVEIDGKRYEVQFDAPFWPGFGDIGDDGKKEGWARLSYDFADCFLLVYPVVGESRFTFDDWLPEHFAWCQKTRRRPCALVANKIESTPRIVSEEEGRALAARLCVDYFETSGANGSPQVKECFLRVLREAIRQRDSQPEREEKKCTIF